MDRTHGFIMTISHGRIEKEIPLKKIVNNNQPIVKLHAKCE